VVELPEGSWGDGGRHQVWLNDDTRWTWGPIYAAEARFERLAGEAAGRPREPLLERLLTQSGRELLLLEASDWQFLITTFAARDYAELRLAEHAESFERLAALAALAAREAARWPRPTRRSCASASAATRCSRTSTGVVTRPRRDAPRPARPAPSGAAAARPRRAARARAARSAPPGRAPGAPDRP